jgi:hypothetical protein
MLLLTAIVFSLTAVPASWGASSATIVVPDRLCFPNEQIHVEAYLYRKGLFGLFRRGIQGEVLRFVDPQGNPLRVALTDPSGLARALFKAGPSGHYPVTVSLADNPRYSADPSEGNVFVHRRSVPLLFITVEEGLMPTRSLPFLPEDPSKLEPMPGSVRALSEVSACYVLVYLTLWPKPSCDQIRSWIENNGYPPGPLCFLDSPLLGGLMPEEPSPETDRIESLWRERSVPAHLATRNLNLAKAAADKNIRVLLLGSEAENGSSPEGKEASKKGITAVQGWEEIPSHCACKTDGRTDTAPRQE